MRICRINAGSYISIFERPPCEHRTGENIRDWLHVDDHAEALLQVARRGALGHSYNIGGNNEYSNVAVVRSICRLVDELAPSAAIGRREQLITLVTDRSGHDARYAMDATKISHDLGWTPRYSFETGLRQTVQWGISKTDRGGSASDRASTAAGPTPS